MSCLGNSDYDIVWCFFHLYIPIRRTEPPPTGSKPPNSLHVEHKAFHINIFKGCIHMLSSYLNRSRDCRHGGVLKIFALGSSAGFLSGSYQSGTLSAAYDAGFGAGFFEKNERRWRCFGLNFLGSCIDLVQGKDCGVSITKTMVLRWAANRHQSVGSSHDIGLHEASIDQECWLQLVGKS